MSYSPFVSLSVVSNICIYSQGYNCSSKYVIFNLILLHFMKLYCFVRSTKIELIIIANVYIVKGDGSNIISNTLHVFGSPQQIYIVSSESN